LNKRIWASLTTRLFAHSLFYSTAKYDEDLDF